MEEAHVFLKELKKAELHVHLEGTVTPRLLSFLAEQNDVSLTTPVNFPNTPPYHPPQGITEEAPLLNSFQDFIGLYVKIVECIQTPKDILLISEEYAKQAQGENITDVEIYFSPTTFLSLGRDVYPLFEGLKAAQERVATVYGVHFTWIFDIVRNSSRHEEEVLELATDAKKMGVSVGAIGLAGYEAVASANRFKAAFKKAKQLGFHTLAHAGETAGPESIEEALALEPLRIGHGITALKSPSLVKKLRELQIPIEVCPWSNICLKLTDKNSHPLPEMLHQGLNVILGSDDPGIFQKSLVDNYLLAHELGISLSELKTLAEKSLQHRLC